MSEHKKKKSVTEQAGKLWAYDPYKVFDSRMGCIVAIALCIGFIVILGMNALLNHVWFSLIFVPLYLWIIVNRLRRLRNMHE